MGIELLDRPDTSAIDPRIRARRIDVRRHAGRRRLQRVVDVGLVLLVGLVFFAALWTPLLDVDEIRVAGVERLTPEDVLDVAGVRPGEPLVRVDPGAVGRRVTELPWVGAVRVDRGLDGVITVEVTERVAVAAVVGPDGPVAVDEAGRVLGSAVDAASPLPQLIGVDPAPVAGDFIDGGGAALRLAARLRTDAPGAFTTIDVDGLVAHLAQGGAVRFGDASRLEAKLRSLRTMLDQVDLSCLAVIDLRLPSSAVLTRDEACS